jgi:hypothetical protein
MSYNHPTPNEKVADEITLHKVNAYAVYASTDERSGGIIGYYKDISVANHKAHKAGWYESNGEVRTAVLHTDGKQLYEVRPLGNYADIAEAERKEIIAGIKSKLSPGELDFIKTHKLD